MSKTGIAIVVSNTVMGAPPQVNANSILFCAGKKETTGAMPFQLLTPYMLRSADDLEVLGITASTNGVIFKAVTDFYSPVQGVSNNGTILWLVGIDNNYTPSPTNVLTKDLILKSIRATTVNGFQFRPRNILIERNVNFADYENLSSLMTPSDVQASVDELYLEGFSTVAIMDGWIFRDEPSLPLEYVNQGKFHAPLVGVVIVTESAKQENINVSSSVTCVGKIGGWMASLSVGTSIGDASLPPISDSLYLMDVERGGDSLVLTPCAKLSMSERDSLGENQYIFGVTRPPRNGIWLNDGATCEDDTSALSTLEAGRTIASLVDDLRSFFTPYINNRIPVTSNGDILPTYRQVVLDNARTTVIAPYISNGDISDARISIVAKNNDMIATRTWEVSLAVLPSPTLRWIDGHVFYVKSLNL